MRQREEHRRGNQAAFRVALIALLLGASFCYGFVSHRNRLFPYGIVRQLYRFVSRQSRPEADGAEQGRPVKQAERRNDKQKEQLSKLAALPYLRAYAPAPEKRNVTVYKEDLAFDGLNIYVSGHASEAFLIDMNGRVLHTWKYDYRRFRRDHSLTEDEDKYWNKRPSEDHDHMWRRVHLLDDGSLLAVYDDIALIKIDKESDMLWAYVARCHHDVCVTDDGTIYVLMREQHRIEIINRNRDVFPDFVAILDQNGEEKSRISLLKCFGTSSYTALLARMNRFGDLFHTNTLEVFDGSLANKSALFREGNAMISMLNMDTIAIVDLHAEKVVWALCGMWRKQHQPTLLENGNMLVFDNQGNQGASKVMEFHPFTQEVLWEYKGDSNEEFSSRWLGSCQRLPNGNTLITESTKGRAFEVTRDNEIVWEFVNPHRVGPNDEEIATLFEMVRLGPASSLGWLAQETAEK